MSAQKTADLSKKQHKDSSTLTWDTLQLLAQSDLHMKSVRESHYSKFLSNTFSQSLKAKASDRVARKDRDKKDLFFSDKLDRHVTEETDRAKVDIPHFTSDYFLF